MGHLADDGDVHKTFDEAPHDRRRNKAGHPAHAHDSKKKEKNADQNGEGGGEGIKLRRPLWCDGADGCELNSAVPCVATAPMVSAEIRPVAVSGPTTS